MMRDTEHFFPHVYWLLVYFLWRNVCSDPCFLFYLGKGFFFVCLFVFNVLRGMCILVPQLGTEPTHPGVGTQES